MGGCGAPKPILDGEKCLAHVRKLVEIGPRPSNSPGAEKTRAYIAAQLEAAGHKSVEDRFAARTVRGIVPMVNVRCEIEGESPKVVALVTHYDTKRFADFVFVGANDGGSGVGVLLEIAHHFGKGRPKPPVTLRLLFVDGEETQWSVQWNDEDALHGSRAEVERLQREKKLASLAAVLVLDMVGDKDLDILRVSDATPALSSWLEEAAKEVGSPEKFFQRIEAITDDHQPFLAAQVPEVANLIDFRYGPSGPTGGKYWHTAEDTLDKLSAESLRLVGDVVIRALPKIAERAK